MKVFFTPAINGQYRPEAKRRMADRPDNEVYTLVKNLCGPEAINNLDRDGYVKVISRDSSGRIDGYFTYQQDEL